MSQITIIKQAYIKQNDDDDYDEAWTSYIHLRRFDVLKIIQPITDQFLTIHIIHINSMILDLILALLYKSNINIDHLCIYTYRRHTFVDQCAICSH